MATVARARRNAAALQDRIEDLEHENDALRAQLQDFLSGGSSSAPRTGNLPAAAPAKASPGRRRGRAPRQG